VGPTGGSAFQRVTVPPSAAGQDRQPNWSPDHTKIAYGVVNGANTEIRVLDLTTGSDTPFVAAAANQDRPTWSPDGTKIAYGAGGKIFVKPYPSGSAVAVTNGTSDERPVWSPDGNTIYYNHTVGADLFDIVKRSPVTLAGTETPMITGGANDWQTAVSPDGLKLCFLRGPKDNGADLYTASAINPNNAVAEFANDPGGLGSLNCVWSPDGTKIAYTEGAFSQGQLVVKDLTASSTSAPTVISDVGGVFDGNADWAVNFTPTCQDKTVNISVNGFVQIPLPCTDQDASSSDAISREIVSPPGHGNIGEIGDDNSVIYTPNKNFSGTDSFTFKGNDGTSDSNTARITVNVNKGGSSTSGKDVTAATIGTVTASPPIWRGGSALPSFSFASRAHKVGTTISFRLSEAATVTLTFARPLKGRRVGKRCVKPTRRNRAKRRCTRFKTAGRIKFNGRSGLNKVKFQGRLSRSKRLRVGRYRLTVGAKDAAGNVSKNKTANFRIVRR
jgi:hypothetical protein